MKPKMYINVVHRIDNEARLDIFLKQQEICHRHHIKTTIMIQPDGLVSKKIIAVLKKEAEEYGDEIAIGLHGLGQEIKREFGIKETILK